MKTKQAAPNLDPEQLQADVEHRIRDSGETWRRYTCRLVTPMYGGGVIPGEVDRDMPIRATAIRGQLRYWWRLLHRHLDSRTLFAAERAVWGGLGEGDLAASKVLITVENWSLPVPEAVGRYPRRGTGHRATLEWEEWAHPYALFPAQGKVERGQIKDNPRSVAREGLTWTLRLAFRDLPREAAQRHELVHGVDEAVRWWASFGGVGARTRRGLGALEITSVSPGSFAYVSAAEAEQAGLQLTLKAPEASATAAWKLAVDALRSFRQGQGIGRNGPARDSRSPAGRSLWPEPDAIRRLVGSPSLRHPAKHEAGNVFPRAAFGLPIIFHFKDSDDPNDSELVPLTGGKRHDRMASPLIIRPYPASQGKWHPAILSLPSDHVWRMELELRNSGKGENAGQDDASKVERNTELRNSKKEETAGLPQQLPPGAWWPADDSARQRKTALIKPLTGRGSDPLAALVAYFTPPAGVAPTAVMSAPLQEETWEKAQIKYIQRNGTVEATGPNNRAATAIQQKGQEIWDGLSPAARSQITGGRFFRAVAVVKGKDLLRVEEKQ